ncbi:hypothetical protein V5799_030673 [Amblyomma americanum]|uniref:Uncharacterized protein n=1 Tax=Amblyomma americanum TaxID=6943 RepID=A0AAQ4ENE7_AMBAM
MCASLRDSPVAHLRSSDCRIARFRRRGSEAPVQVPTPEGPASSLSLWLRFPLKGWGARSAAVKINGRAVNTTELFAAQLNYRTVWLLKTMEKLDKADVLLLFIGDTPLPRSNYRWNMNGNVGCGASDAKEYHAVAEVRLHRTNM